MVDVGKRTQITPGMNENIWKCPNCGKEHPSYARMCKIWRKEKEIMTVKHSKSISFAEVSKIMEGYMEGKTTPKMNMQENHYKYDSLMKRLSWGQMRGRNL